MSPADYPSSDDCDAGPCTDSTARSAAPPALPPPQLPSNAAGMYDESLHNIPTVNLVIALCSTIAVTTIIVLLAMRLLRRNRMRVNAIGGNGQLVSSAWASRSNTSSSVTQPPSLQPSPRMAPPPPVSDEVRAELGRQEQERQALVTALPVFMWHAGSRHNERCIFCMDHYKNGEMLRRLPCKHVYHRECIDRWYATANGTRDCARRVAGVSLSKCLSQCHA
jgi:hypothetical protein